MTTEQIDTKLAEIDAEKKRQFQFVGERIGVTAKLRDLERAERRLRRKREEIPHPFQQFHRDYPELCASCRFTSDHKVHVASVPPVEGGR